MNAAAFTKLSHGEQQVPRIWKSIIYTEKTPEMHVPFEGAVHSISSVSRLPDSYNIAPLGDSDILLPANKQQIFHVRKIQYGVLTTEIMGMP